MNSKIAVAQLKKLEKLVNKEEDVGRLAAEGWDEDWKCLIAIMLSAQTRDNMTIPVCNLLFTIYETPEKLAKANILEIEKYIKQVNYHKTKARNIKQTAKLISEKGIPLTVEKLIEFPGVGRKTANVFLAEAHGKDTIGVDTHVARLSQKLDWTKNETPEKIEKDLENLFPKEYWNSLNHILVRFGQTFGRSRKREDELLKEIFIN